MKERGRRMEPYFLHFFASFVSGFLHIKTEWRGNEQSVQIPDLSDQKTGRNLAVTPAQYKKMYPFLKEPDSLALANVQMQLSTAYKNFF
jgi:hypothetical protein